MFVFLKQFSIIGSFQWLKHRSKVQRFKFKKYRIKKCHSWEVILSQNILHVISRPSKRQEIMKNPTFFNFFPQNSVIFFHKILDFLRKILLSLIKLFMQLQLFADKRKKNPSKYFKKHQKSHQSNILHPFSTCKCIFIISNSGKLFHNIFYEININKSDIDG